MRWMAFRMLIVRTGRQRAWTRRVFIGHFAVGFASKRAGAARVAGRADGGAAVPRPAVADLPARRGRERAHRPGQHGGHAAGSARLPVVAQPGDVGGVVGAVRGRCSGPGRTMAAARSSSRWACSATGCSTSSPIARTCRSIPAAARSVGLGLWNSLPATLAVEVTLFVAGVAIYARATRAMRCARHRRVLAAGRRGVDLYVEAIFGPPPPSVDMIKYVRPDVVVVRGLGVVDRPQPRAARPRAGGAAASVRLLVQAVHW